MWLGLLLACGESADVAPRAPLASPSFRFCHVSGADREEALVWCDLLDDASREVCPGLAATCDGAEAAPPVGCDPGSQGEAKEGALAPPPESPNELPALEGLEGLQGLARWVMAILVALGVLWLARILMARFGRRERRETDEDLVLYDAEEEEIDDVLPEVPAAPAADLMALARRALEAGELEEAAVLARGAALRGLGERGVLRLHRSHTDREYVSALVGEPELQVALLQVVRAAEDVRFGGRAMWAQRARQALAAADRLLGAAVCLSLLLGATAHAQAGARFSPSGDVALKELLQAHGMEVSWRQEALTDLGEETEVLVVDLSGMTPGEEHWEAILQWVEQGGVLLVGGDAEHALPELGAYASAEGEVEGTVWLGGGLPTPEWPDGPVFAWSAGEGLTLVGVGEGAAVEVLLWGDGVVVAVADPRLLWNGAMLSAANQGFLGELLPAGLRWGWPLDEPITVELATMGAASSPDSGGPAQTLANTRLLPFVLQLLAAWGLLMLWRGVPFGPLRDPPGEGRLSFTEHVEALGRRYRQIGATRRVWSASAQLWMARRGLRGLRAAAEVAGLSQEAAQAWALDVERVAEDPHGPDAPDDLEHVEELWKIMEPRR